MLTISSFGQHSINNNTNHYADRHKVVGNLLGNEIGKMQIDTAIANTFISYVEHSLLIATTGTYDKSTGGTGFVNSDAKIQFCDNGTFVEVLSGHIDIEGYDIGAVASDTSYMPGYWEAAALPNRMMVIIMYSTHPNILEDFAIGILPFIVAEHGVDYVSLPSGDVYRRIANQYCN